MNKDEAYKIIAREIQENALDAGIWLRAKVESDSADLDAVTIKYTKLRLDALISHNSGAENLVSDNSPTVNRKSVALILPEKLNNVPRFMLTMIIAILAIVAFSFIYHGMYGFDFLNSKSADDSRGDAGGAINSSGLRFFDEKSNSNVGKDDYSDLVELLDIESREFEQWNRKPWSKCAKKLLRQKKSCYQKNCTSVNINISELSSSKTNYGYEYTLNSTGVDAQGFDFNQNVKCHIGRDMELIEFGFINL